MGKSFLYKGYMYQEVFCKNPQKGCKLVKFTSPTSSTCTGNIYCSTSGEFHKACQLVIDNYKKAQAYDLHCDFDIEKHKKTYINYLEVIIMPTGKVSYAVPSHTAKLESIACSKLEIDRDTLLSRCPREMWLDYNQWLMETTGCIMVWTDFYLGKANEYQLSKLEELKEAGIYLGGFESGYESKSINNILNNKRS